MRDAEPSLDNYAYYETPFLGTKYLAKIEIAASELEKGKSNSERVFLISEKLFSQ